MIKISRKRRTELLLFLQTGLLTVLLYWMHLESQTNVYFRAWLTQNFPVGLLLLNEWIVAGAIAELFLITGYWIIQLEGEEIRKPAKPGKIEEPVAEPEPVEQSVSQPSPRYGISRPFYETVEIRTLIILVILLTQAVSLWFITAATFRITLFTANSFYYYSHLPITYWWGLIATLALFFTRSRLRGDAQIGLDISSVFLLAFYLIGLPSFSYQDPRFLDTYYHTGNSLDLLNYYGWLGSPNWYVHQFPGVFAFIAQLVSVAGIDPLQLMKFYPIGLTLVVVFLTYVTARAHSQRYASLASAVLLGGMWFQLHISPQSLELILYLGIIFLFVKILDDQIRRRQWTLLALTATPIFVASHPETPLAVTLGLAGFLFLSLLRSKRMLNKHFSEISLPLIGLLGFILFWWGIVAVDARTLVQASIIDKAVQALFRAPLGTTVQTSNVAATPSFSYGLTILSEQLISVIIWAVGLSYFAIFRKLQTRELFLSGLFIAAVSTIPIAVFGRADVLQRSYLFALVPFVILTAWLLERKTSLMIRGHSMFRILRAGFIIMLVLFAIIIPLTRYGVDPIEYIPASSLQISNISATLDQQHSILFLHPDEDGWRFYAGINGAIREPKLEQKNMANTPGGYVKPGSDPTVPGFNMTYTPADKSANYIVLTSYWQNFYLLRFGPNSAFYTQTRENYTAMVNQNFDLVYSTGTDQIYVNQALG